MVSLLHLAEITERGVAFKSPRDGSDMLLTPEHSIAVQNRLGARAQLTVLMLQGARQALETACRPSSVWCRL